MAGRAGRRGKDTVGYVFYLPDITMRREPLVVVKDMMTGRPATVSSQMTFGYEFLLKALHSERLTWNGLLTASYWQALNEEQAKKLETQRETLLAKKPVLEPDCDQRYALEQEFKNGNRKVQGAIETWKNRHPGPKWETAWKQYAAWKQSELVICAIEVNMRTLREPPAMLLHRLDYLERTGFIKDGRLTQLGHMAADINEGNPLVMARAFYEKALHDCNAHDLVAILCCFIEGKPDGYPPQLMDIYLDLKKKETVGQQEWLCYNTWCDPIYEWLEGQDFGAVCETYEVDAGNLSRAILKAANLLDEWVNMATYCEDLEMLEKCRGVRETLIRGLVVPDSLYLRV
jgi:superfamily II RNA helicase